MSEEEERPKRPEFRVVDKRISARGDQPAPEAPTAKPAPESPTSPPPAEPEVEPPVAQAGEPASQANIPAAESQAPPAGGEEPIWTPEQEAEAQRFIQEIGQRPSLDWVLNSAVTLANVAGTKIDLGQVADAQLAIDALAAMVDKLGSRFGQAEAPLRQTLAQLQLAYAERSIAPRPGVPGTGAPQGGPTV